MTPQGQVDVAIIFALEEEFDVFCEHVRPQGRTERDHRTARAFLLYDQLVDGQAPYRCVTSFIGTMGAEDAGVFTSMVLTRYRPATVVVIGLAGSLNDDVLVGDVVVPDEVDSYLQDGKVTPSGFVPSGRTYRPHVRLTNVIRYLRLTHPEAFAELERESRADVKRSIRDAAHARLRAAIRTDAARTHIGHLASGPVVGASKDFADWLRSRDRKYLALEMETAGVMNVVYQHAGDERLLAIRAISDLSDDRKSLLDGVGGGALRALAMRNAVRLLNVLMRAGEFDRAVPLATVPMPDELLRLDRHKHRSCLDDLLALPCRVLVVLIHGEADQGHEHFEKVALWRTRAAEVQGPWRRRRIEWPQPSPRADMRLGLLLDSFATAVGATFAPTAPKPTSGAGEDAWLAALEPALAACDRSSDRLFLHHTITKPVEGDLELWTRYLHMVWLRLAARRRAHVVCCLKLRRAERAGFPLSRAWRLTRSQHRIARAIATSLDKQAVPDDGYCAALPELSSATLEDIGNWLRAERQFATSEAIAEAEQIVTLTRGGRFDLVIEHLAELLLDTRR